MKDRERHYATGAELWEYGRNGEEWTKGVTELALAAREGHEGALRTLHEIAGISRDGRRHNTRTQGDAHGRGAGARGTIARAGKLLGEAYATGTGVPQDDAIAAQCYEAAARQERPRGTMGLTGAGTQR